MFARAALLVGWGIVLFVVDAYVIHALWGQLLFTVVSLAAMSYLQDKISPRNET